MRSAHSRARRSPQLGQRPLALHEGEESLGAAVLAAQLQKAKVGVAALREPLEEIDHARREGTVGAGEALVVDASHGLEEKWQEEG